MEIWIGRCKSILDVDEFGYYFEDGTKLGVSTFVHVSIKGYFK